MPAEQPTGSDKLAHYVEWLQNVWLPNVGRGLTYPGFQPKPKLTLIRGGRDDAR